MTEVALPYIEALAALREEAVRHGHDMAPAQWVNGILTSGCARCGAECGVYRRLIVQGHAKMVRGTDKPCGPTKGAETFPILTWHLKQFPGVPECPASIPYHLVKAHEQQAMHNHGQQSVQRLKERGGLDPREAWFVLHDQPYRDGQITMLAAIRYLRQICGIQP